MTDSIHTMSLPVAAERLGVSRATLTKWVEDGKIKFLEIDGRKRFTEDMLIAFINDHISEQ